MKVNTIKIHIILVQEHKTVTWLLLKPGPQDEVQQVHHQPLSQLQEVNQWAIYKYCPGVQPRITEKPLYFMVRNKAVIQSLTATSPRLSTLPHTVTEEYY